MDRKPINEPMNSNTWSNRGSKRFNGTSTKPPPPAKPPRKSLARGLSEQQSQSYHQNYYTLSHPRKAPSFDHYLSDSGASANERTFKRSVSNDGEGCEDDEWTIYTTNRLSTFLGPDKRNTPSYSSSTQGNIIHDNCATSRSTTNMVDASLSSNFNHQFHEKENHQLQYSSQHAVQHHHTSDENILRTVPMSKTTSSSSILIPSQVKDEQFSGDRQRSSYPVATHTVGSFPSHHRHPHLSQHLRSKSEHHPRCPNRPLHCESNVHNDDLGIRRPSGRIPLSVVPVKNSTESNFLSHATDNDPPPPPQVAQEEINAVIDPLYQNQLACQRDACARQTSSFSLQLADKNGTSLDSSTHSSCCSSSYSEGPPEEEWFSVGSSGMSDCQSHESSLEYLMTKKKNRHDAATCTDDNILTIEDCDGKRVFVKLRKPKLIVKCEDKIVATDKSLILTGLEENPFEGLCRGSKVSRKSEPIQDGRKSLRKNKLAGKNTLERRKKTRSLDLVKAASLSIDSSGPVDIKSNAETAKINSLDLERSLLSRLSFDENKEWAEIAEIFASFGSGFARTPEKLDLFVDSLPSVEEWLKGISLERLHDILISNGFDDVEFMGSNVMGENDLIEIGINNAEDRKNLLEAAKKLPKLKQLADEDKSSVANWLASLRLKEYEPVFLEKGFDSLDKVRKIWDIELSAALQITKIGHKKRILASLGERLSLICDFGLESLDFNKLSFDLDDLRVPDAEIGQDSTRNIDSRSDANSTKANDLESSRVSISSDLRADLGESQSSSFRSSINSNLLPFNSSQWKHDPLELYENGCRYESHYLGSALVTHLEGVKSTRDSIMKLKESTKGIKKIPTVTLEISCTGVKFIDSQTNKLVCEHEIRNIHCACQDVDNFKYFAYITKEHETSNHFCHVFCAESLDMATEVILTLGQAFEIAYSLTLGESVHKLRDAYLKSQSENKLNDEQAMTSSQTEQSSKSNESLDSQDNTRKNFHDISIFKQTNLITEPCQKTERTRYASLTSNLSSENQMLHKTNAESGGRDTRTISKPRSKTKDKPKVPIKPPSLIKSFVSSTGTLPRKKAQ